MSEGGHRRYTGEDLEKLRVDVSNRRVKGVMCCDWMTELQFTLRDNSGHQVCEIS